MKERNPASLGTLAELLSNRGPPWSIGGNASFVSPPKKVLQSYKLIVGHKVQNEPV
jgi:hypothetical protein